MWTSASRNDWRSEGGLPASPRAGHLDLRWANRYAGGVEGTVDLRDEGVQAPASRRSSTSSRYSSSPLGSGLCLLKKYVSGDPLEKPLEAAF